MDEPTDSAAVQEFWAAFVAATGIDGPYEAWAFGTEETPKLATELALLVCDGTKRATTGLLSEYVAEGEELPESGQMSVILDGAGDPMCVIRMTQVETCRFGDVDQDFAWDEGEGDRSLTHWRRAHVDFFTSIGQHLVEDSIMVLQRFELLWPLSGGRAS